MIVFRIAVFDHERKDVLFVDPLFIEDIEVQTHLHSRGTQLLLQIIMDLIDFPGRNANIVDIFVVELSELLPKELHVLVVLRLVMRCAEAGGHLEHVDEVVP